jgi:hypothetical protein
VLGLSGVVDEASRAALAAFQKRMMGADKESLNLAAVGTPVTVQFTLVIAVAWCLLKITWCMIFTDRLSNT